jgi:hypothetical protein
MKGGGTAIAIWSRYLGCLFNDKEENRCKMGTRLASQSMGSSWNASSIMRYFTVSIMAAPRLSSFDKTAMPKFWEGKRVI